MAKKKKDGHKASPEEIANDGSLKYFPYGEGEPLWCDTRNGYARFVRYEGDQIRVSELDSMREAELVDVLSVRRLTARWTREELIQGYAGRGGKESCATET